VPARWRVACLAVALLTALPTAYFANQALLQTRVELHTRLIVQHSLWESDAAYAGSPRDWTRFAAWLLDTEQLLDRVRALHPAEAVAIEEDYRRDTLLAFGSVIARHLAYWAIPLGLALAAGLFAERRQAQRSA
jgi:hypothetical protein